MEDLLIVKDLYEPIDRAKYPGGYWRLNGNFFTERQWPPSDSVST